MNKIDAQRLLEDKNLVHVLPIAAYTSQEWFDLEMQTIFSTTWQFAGLVEDVSSAGDYISVQAGLNNIFIVKGRDQRLRGFHNMCRHRGTQLLRAVGKNQKSITCPYHDWTYNLEGKLQSIPKCKEEFPLIQKQLETKELHECDLNLHEASVDIFKGMLFVHPDKDAPSIMEFFGDVLPNLGPHSVEDLVEYSETEGEPFYVKDIDANWKIIAENYIDQYHLAQLHSNTLNMYDHANAKFGWSGPHYWFFERLVKEFEEKVEKVSPAVLIKSVPKDKMGAYVPWLFPNIGISETEGAWNTFHAIPIAPNKTRVVIRSKVENVSEWKSAKQYTKGMAHSFWSSHGNKGKYHEEPKTKQSIDPMSSGDFMAEDVLFANNNKNHSPPLILKLALKLNMGNMPLVNFRPS